jgi:predicted ATPase/class 3 adenylate cyclase
MTAGRLPGLLDRRPVACAGVGVTELPSGTVTFLFTDVEGSTRLWEQHADAMRQALARHDEIVRGVIDASGGRVVKTTGDGFHAVFATAHSGVESALEAQLALAEEVWGETGPLRVRMGLHTGVAELRDGDYYGSVLNRAARLMSVAHGGQVVVSQVTEQLVRDAIPPEITFVDLGDHRLRDLTAPLRVFQLSYPGLELHFPPLRSLGSAGSNLPVQRSSFVGRERDLERLRDLMKERRLLTLTGVGGVGKTRLALQAAADALGAFPGGSWLVELARTGDPDAVVPVVVTALGAVPQPGRSEIDVVCDHLGSTRSILLLDNCEHVLDAAADLTSALLDRCPRVVVLATSREPLDLDGEQVVPVRPLDPATDAVALFAERARGVDPEFELDRGTELAVQEICRRLDGVPLAVELAAARIDAMPPADIAARLDDRFRLLASGRRRSVDRHQTLRATLEWSHQLLDDDEQALLRRLGVFAGGFPASAVDAVCVTSDDSLDVHDVLASLVRKSLVQFDRDAFPERYRLLETVRVFALEQLAHAGESETLGRAHAEWIAGLVGHPMEEWYSLAVDRRAITREFDNWREAVGYALSTSDPVLALRLTAHGMAADIPETARWSEAALSLAGMSDLDGSRWLHLVAAVAKMSALDADGCAHHVSAFEAGCSGPRDLFWTVPLRAARAFLVDEDPVQIVEAGLANPGLSAFATQHLHLFRSLYRNLPPNTDVRAARIAVECAIDDGARPVALAFLAMALREVDPRAALDALRRAEELAERTFSEYTRTTVMSFGSMAVLALPTASAAHHLRERLERLQPHWDTSAAALLTLCISVLQRVKDPAVPTLCVYVRSSPGGARYLDMLAPDLACEPFDELALAVPEQLEEAVALAGKALQTLLASAAPGSDT